MKRIGLLLLCGLLLPSCYACRRDSTGAAQPASDEQVTFPVAPSLHQKQVYSVVNRTNGQTLNKDPKENESAYRRNANAEVMEVQSELETEVIAIGANGGWTLSNKLTAHRFRIERPGEKPQEEEVKAHEIWDSSFAVAFARDGSIEKLPDEARSLTGLFGQMNPVLLLPAVLLPQRAVRAGEAWPIELSRSIPDEDRPEPLIDSLKGTGVVKEIHGGRAVIEFNYTIDTQRFGKPMTTQKVKSSVTYDLQKRQFLSNQLEMVCETIGWAFSDNETDIKSIFNSSVKVEAKL